MELAIFDIAMVAPLHQRPYLTRKEAARYLTTRGYPVVDKTLRNFAANGNAGNGPPFERLGARVCYRLEDLDNWLARRRIVVA